MSEWRPVADGSEATPPYSRLSMGYTLNSAQHSQCSAVQCRLSRAEKTGGEREEEERLEGLSERWRGGGGAFPGDHQSKVVLSWDQRRGSVQESVSRVWVSPFFFFFLHSEESLNSHSPLFGSNSLPDGGSLSSQSCEKGSGKSVGISRK